MRANHTVSLFNKEGFKQKHGYVEIEEDHRVLSPSKPSSANNKYCWKFIEVYSSLAWPSQSIDLLEATIVHYEGG